ncbi:NADH dehydrogenase [Aphelenchoides besseyi]|nr:NADH dehydrogenase [Aphelenchoides besseyi]KAI6195490.1 NADH dehydrogenase [Aphelenchoides besseyi]
MGTQFSVIAHDTINPKCAPRSDRPATFDPLYGFPKGRKPREMKATWEEMDAAGLNAGERDYCAHLLIDFKACQRKWAPLAGHACAHTRHVYDECEYEDHLIRLKEYERERRLLHRKLRKEKAAGLAS